MTSLTDVYEGTHGSNHSRRLYAGTALVLVGALLAVVAVLLAATDLFGGFVGSLGWEMGETYASVRIGGLLAGLGVPVALVGVFTVLPAGRRVRAAAAISASLCLLGVALFWYAYPTTGVASATTLPCRSRPSTFSACSPPSGVCSPPSSTSRRETTLAACSR